MSCEVAQFAEVDVRQRAGDGEAADRARVVAAVGDVVLEELAGDRVEALGRYLGRERRGQRGLARVHVGPALRGDVLRAPSRRSSSLCSCQPLRVTPLMSYMAEVATALMRGST